MGEEIEVLCSVVDRAHHGKLPSLAASSSDRVTTAPDRFYRQRSKAENTQAHTVLQIAVNRNNTELCCVSERQPRLTAQIVRN